MNYVTVPQTAVHILRTIAGLIPVAFVVGLAQCGDVEALAVFPLVAGKWNPLSSLGKKKPSEFGTPKPNELNSPSDRAPAAQELDRRLPPQDTNEYLTELLADGRYALLLRPQVVENLDRAQLTSALDALRDEMALVPEGDVVLMQPRFDAQQTEAGLPAGAVLRVEPLFLDRYPVTNRCFKRFVDARCYEDSSLWDHAVLSAVLDFVDQTGCPGPKFWQNGTFSSSLADHPVVGISQYEASAYARWVGKRLPTDAEWVKAGAWPVSTAGSDRPSQRKYPWGDSMDGERANLWASGPGHTVAVSEYPAGVSVGGIHQLIGNVWEWTSCPFGTWHPHREQLEQIENFVSLRGGAFDTYFDSHAVCQFQSGDSPLARKHNLGFRCAVTLSELTPRVLQS